MWLGLGLIIDSNVARNQSPKRVTVYDYWVDFRSGGFSDGMEEMRLKPTSDKSNLPLDAFCEGPTCPDKFADIWKVKVNTWQTVDGRPAQEVIDQFTSIRMYRTAPFVRLPSRSCWLIQLRFVNRLRSFLRESLMKLRFRRGWASVRP
jgi:hypothetical protein